MADKRKTDYGDGTYFRSRRIVRDNGQWFFLTREGTVEGPYASEEETQEHLKTYVKLIKTRWLEKADKYSLVPK